VSEVTKYDVLAHVEQRGSATAQDIAEHFGLSEKAAYRHVQRLSRAGLIEAIDGGVGLWGYRRFRITSSGRARLEWWWSQGEEGEIVLV
jgi:predicted ArsR family transcriptional regulator